MHSPLSQRYLALQSTSETAITHYKSWTTEVLHITRRTVQVISNTSSGYKSTNCTATNSENHNKHQKLDSTVSLAKKLWSALGTVCLPNRLRQGGPSLQVVSMTSYVRESVELLKTTARKLMH